MTEVEKKGIEDHGLVSGSAADQKVMVNLVSVLSIAYTTFKMLVAVVIFGVVWLLLRYRRPPPPISTTPKEAVSPSSKPIIEHISV